MNVKVKKTFSVISAAFALCCGVFVGAAPAQDYDSWGDYNSSPPTEMSMPEPDNSYGSSSSPWDTPSAPAEQPKPAPSNAAKPEKAVAAQKDAKPKAAPTANSDRNFNIFINTGYGFGQGGFFLREVNAISVSNGAPANDNKDYYMNMGQGLKFEAGVGYMATPNFEARFSADFNIGLFAPKIEAKTLDKNDPKIVLGTEIKDYSYWSWGVRAMAVPWFELLEMLDMYIGTGLSLNFAYGTEDSTFRYPDNATDNTVYETRFSPSLGLCGVVGFILPFSEVTDFFGELQFESKSFTLNKKRLKTSQLSERFPGTPPTDISYKKNDSNLGIDNALSLIPGSNWGLRVGLRFWFGL
jgi:hypothetical protein